MQKRGKTALTLVGFAVMLAALAVYEAVNGASGADGEHRREEGRV